jgi:hypothetical protein
MNASTIRVYNPTAPENDPQQARRGLESLAGKVVGFIDNAKPNFHYLVDDLAHLLTEKYGISAIVKRRKISAGIPAPDAMMKEIVEQCDAVIAGSGD